MTTSDAFQPSGGVSSLPSNPAADSATLLPPPPQPAPRPPDAGATIRLLDILLAAGAAALAFLLALLPARNSDVWLHLAGGRLLANGQYHFGVDPFSFTTSGVYWVNPCWLYDLLSFYLFQWGDGAAFVFAKAVLMALLAWLLIRAGRTTTNREQSGSGWIAAVFAVVALLIIGSSMPLRPICVSYVFLALTLWLLEKGLSGERPASLVSWWPVPLLFAVWVNMDAWFLLGPLTVGLYFLGSLLTASGRKGQAGTLGLVFLAGMAACLLNPHHYRAFAVPALLPFTDEAAILRDDPLFGRLWQSPFQREFLHFQDIPHLGRLLYYPLVVVGLASFLRGALAARTGGTGAVSACLRRLPVWLFFLALSALDASTIPFLAIVSAPLVGAFPARGRRQPAEGAYQPADAGRSPLGAIGGRVVTLTLVLGLLIAAWPGWLQGQLRAPRGWFIDTDSSLVDAVHQLAQWRQEGLLHPAESGFNFSTTAAHYFAWFSTDEKSFCDARWRPCAAAAGDYITVRRALLGENSALDAARRILRERHISYLLLHDSDVQSSATVFQRLVTAPGEWVLLFLKGDTIVFGWRDPEKVAEADRFAAQRLDFHRRAFQPAEDEQAPVRSAVLGPNATGWRSFWTTASAAPSHARDEAALYLIYFDLLRPLFLTRHRIAWEYGLAAAIAAPGPALTELPRRFLDASVLQVSRLGPRPRLDGGIWPLDALATRLTESYDMAQDDGPPSLALLAVRAARRAANENPNDARAYQLLGESYLHLAHSTRERAWKRDFSSLLQVRHIQTAVALHRALLLQPDLIQVHTDLYALYMDMGLFDLALQQLRHMLRLTPSHGNKPDGKQLAIAVGGLEEEVRKREDRFENQAAHGSVLEKALRALDNGLGGKALEILLASDVAVFGRQGAQMELELLLTVGRIDDARQWLLPSLESELGSDTYHRLRVKLLAADGDYQACQEELAQLMTAFNRPMIMIFQTQKFSHTKAPRPTPAAVPQPISYRLQTSLRQMACLKVGQILLDAPRQKQSIPSLLMNRLQTTEFLDHLKTLAQEMRQQAEVQALRGALALEQGDVSGAEAFLRSAAAIERSAADAASTGRSAVDGILDWLSHQQAMVP